MAIFTAIASVGAAIGSFIGGLGLVGSFFLRTAVGVGLNLLAQAIAGKPEKPTFSINGTLQGGGDLPRSFILGRTATAGSLVWANTWGKDGDTPNAYLTQVIALSDMPSKGLLALWVNNEKVTISDTVDEYGNVITEYVKDGKRNLWIRFYDGTQTEADSLLVHRASNGNRHWPQTRIGKGITYAVITARVSKNMFSGIPSFKFELDGMRLYDISKDSSAGGNGPHRYGDPSTWGGDGDYLPAVQNYNLLRGIRYEGKWIYGVQGMSGARLPADNWIAAINKCRETIAGAHGPEPLYRSGGEITIDAPLSIALEAINATCQGRIAEIGGIYHMHVGAPDAPVIHFTDDDILSTEEQSFTPFFGLADTINGIAATYPSPADGWVIKSAPPIYRTDLEAKHGNRRLMASVELTFVPYAEQVQRLMNSALLEGQRARRHTIVLPPKFWAYATPGTIVSWTSKRNGYVNKLMRIDGVSDRANLDVLIDLTEVDPSDYDWDSGSDFKPPMDGAVGPMRPLPQPIIDFSAMPDVAQDANGNNRRCAILLGWDGDKDNVDLVRFEVRQSWDLAVNYTGRTEDVSRGFLLIAPGILLPNTDYQVRARYDVYDGSRDFEWSDWITVRTLDIRFGPLDLYPIDIGEVVEEIGDSLKWLSDSHRHTQEELDRLGAIATENDAIMRDEVRRIREEVTLTSETITASYIREITAAVGPGSAIVARIETLEVKVDDDIASAMDYLLTEIVEVDGKVNANAALITALTAQVDQVSASVNIRGEAAASPGGGWARWGAQVKVGSADTWSSAAFYIDTNGNLSRFVVAADQFLVTDSTGTSRQPLLFTGGELYVANVRLGTLKFDQLESNNGKMILRGYGNFSDIRMWT